MRCIVTVEGRARKCLEVIRSIGFLSQDSKIGQNAEPAVAVISTGFVVQQIGLLVLGFGTDRAGDAVRLENPDYRDGSFGWGTYKTGLFFNGACLAILIVPPLAYAQVGESIGENYIPYLIVGIGC